MYDLIEDVVIYGRIELGNVHLQAILVFADIFHRLAATGMQTFTFAAGMGIIEKQTIPDRFDHAHEAVVNNAIRIKGELKNPNEYKNNFGDNMMLYYSTDETIRMSLFAKENFYYFENIFENQKNSNGWSFLVKIGCRYEEDSEERFEHMWFDIKEITENTVKGALINTPYFINDMKNGEEYELSREDMSDWIIYTPSMTINANNVYMYNKLYNNAGSERNS